MAAGTRGARAASSHKDNGKTVKQLRRSSNKGGISNNKTAVKQQQSRSKAAVKLEREGTTAMSSKRLSTRNVLRPGEYAKYRYQQRAGLGEIFLRECCGCS